RIFRIDPTFLSPNLDGLRCIHSEIVQGSTMSVLRKLRVLKPACWKFGSTIGHVFTAKYSQREHLFRSQIEVESEAKIAAHLLRPPINIVLLHLVVYLYARRFH